MEYTFNSTDPDQYNEIICPINYTGASIQIRWYVSFVNGKSNIVLLDEEDYFTLTGDVKYNVQKTYTNLENIGSKLSEIFTQADISVQVDHANRIILYADTSFTIIDMSERLKYATGFHYLNKVNLTSHQETITVLNDENEYITATKYVVRSKASYFEYLTPIWYIISNLGSPNQVSSLRDKYKNFYPAVSVKIVNTFADGQALSISNGDYQTVSRASALNNLKAYIVDANLLPIKFLSPVYITVCLEEVPLDESVAEALQERPPNKEYIMQLKQKLEENNNKIAKLMSKLERGISAEPELEPIEEKIQENQPRPLSTLVIDNPSFITVDEQNGVLEQTPVVYNDVDINKDDNRTEEKEAGQEKEQEKQIEEQPQKVAEEQEGH